MHSDDSFYFFPPSEKFDVDIVVIVVLKSLLFLRGHAVTNDAWLKNMISCGLVQFFKCDEEKTKTPAEQKRGHHHVGLVAYQCDNFPG